MNRDKWFGSTYQLAAPSNWGSQYLAMNISRGIIDHIKMGFSILNTNSETVTSEKEKYKII